MDADRGHLTAAIQMASLAFALLAAPAMAQDRVLVPSLDGASLPGFLFGRRAGRPQAAIVMLHGCGGLLDHRGQVVARETSWATRLAGLGYAVLAIDSFGPRGVRSMCAPANYVRAVYDARPKDAYGALLWLQSQPGIIPSHVAIMGWSEGGGVLLDAIGAGDPARLSLPHGDFRAAVAFYPARCDPAHHAPWRSPVALLVLIGGSDVWTPAAPCQAMIDTARTSASIVVYPGAYHDFDWPGMPVHAALAFRTRAGVVPIEGNDPAATQDATDRVTEFLAAAMK